jgi:hypothetical protein
MLKIGNYLNAHLHQHVKRHVEANYGKEAVDTVVPPIVVFRTTQWSFNCLGAGGHSDHDDSDMFVSDNHLNYGDEDHNMLVPTFFWSNRTEVSTKVSWAQKGNKSNSDSIQTTSGGFPLSDAWCSNASTALDPTSREEAEKGSPSWAHLQ